MKADTAAEPAAEPISRATLTNGSDSAQPAIEAPVEEKVGEEHLHNPAGTSFLYLCALLCVLVADTRRVGRGCSTGREDCI